jgi:hypothetical protein
MFSVGGVHPSYSHTLDRGNGYHPVSRLLLELLSRRCAIHRGQLFGVGQPLGGVMDGPLSSIKATHALFGLLPLFDFENYIASQVAALWFPTWDWWVSVVNDLHG